METPSTELLDKVKKLMALGASPSEAEAASALDKARSLLARYGLSLADIETGQPEVSEDVLLEKKRFRPWELDLILVVARATFTQALRIQRDGVGMVLLIGREVNTKAALGWFEYLHLVVLKLGRQYSSQGVHVESFRRGLVHRVGERLESPEAPLDPSHKSGDRQLVVQMDKTAQKENSEFIASRYGRARKQSVGRRVDAASYHQGHEAGNRVSLNKQVEG